MKVLRYIGTAVGLLLSLVVLVLLASRYADGPLLPMIAGGPLESGEIVTREPDWRFVHDVREIEFQLLEPPRSRTVWVVEHDGHIYIPCGFVSNRLWKQWPHEAVKDGRAILRIQGKRYPRMAHRVLDKDEYLAVVARVFEKYGQFGEMPTGLDENLWIFRMDPRPS